MAKNYMERLRKEHQDRMEGSQRETLDKFVELESGKVNSVNWKKLVDSNNEFNVRASEGVDNKDWIDVMRYLEIKKVLCNEYEGFFPFNGFDLSPNVAGIKYHFTKKSDALTYAEAKFTGAHYSVRIAEIVTKDRVNPPSI